MSKIIGIGGCARVGKDCLAAAVHSYFNNQTTKRSFAYALKKEVEDEVWRRFNISVFTDIDEKKEIIRPFMVEHGRARREENPRYWIDKVFEAIDPDEITVIPDVRYENECRAIQEAGGKVIHLTRFSNGVARGPANEEEAVNDPRVKEIADFHYSWDDFDEKSGKEEAFKLAKLHFKIFEL